MSRKPDGRIEKARKAFRRQMMLTLAEVADLIDGSIHTARRRLKEWGVLNSYNQNGRYYALPDVPEFDANGLWRKRGVFFSQYGTLKQTVIELVCRSPAGLDAGEMRTLLGLDPRSFLSACAKHPRLRREKTRGRFVYFCADEAVFGKQRQRRRAMNATSRQPTPSEAIAILVEQIKHPALSYEDLSRRLRRQNVSVESEIIQNLFSRHGLTLKKTPHSV